MTSEVEDLQIRLMELSKSIDDMNETVIEQDKTIRFLTQKVDRLEAQLSAMDPAQLGSATFGNDKPPHY